MSAESECVLRSGRVICLRRSALKLIHGEEPGLAIDPATNKTRGYRIAFLALRLALVSPKYLRIKIYH
jgi:hypothetical protein